MGYCTNFHDFKKFLSKMQQVFKRLIAYENIPTVDVVANVMYTGQFSIFLLKLYLKSASVSKGY